MRHRRLQRFLITIVALYPLVALSTYATLDREIFPFFWWELFSYVPSQTGSDYGLRILQEGEQSAQTFIYFEESKELVPNAESIEAKITIQSLGAAIEEDNKAEIDRLRSLTEALHLSNPSIKMYQLVHRTFDLIERWECQCFSNERVIAEFTLHGTNKTE